MRSFLQPVGDEVGDGADLQAVMLGEGHEIGQPGHGPVLVHDLADHAGRIETGQAADVDRRLGMAGADQDEPPSRASSGKMWPGVTMSSLPLVGSMATAMVRALSEAEIPVVTPSRAPRWRR